MFRALIMAAIVNLPDLGVGDAEMGFTTQQKIDVYHDFLEKNLDTGLNKLVDNVIGSDAAEITKEDFLDNLQKPENAKILTSYGCR